MPEDVKYMHAPNIECDGLATFRIDPFEYEVYGAKRRVWLCDCKYQARSDDI